MVADRMREHIRRCPVSGHVLRVPNVRFCAKLSDGWCCRSGLNTRPSPYQGGCRPFESLSYFRSSEISPDFLPAGGPQFYETDSGPVVCPLPEVKRIWLFAARMSPFDPRRTSAWRKNEDLP